LEQALVSQECLRPFSCVTTRRFSQLVRATLASGEYSIVEAAEGNAGTPVIMLTARARESDREEAAAAGADRYLAKTFSPLELLSVVEDLLDRGQSRLAG
jgi:DNA-binding response OmpR family regulator